jgi:hypothetical protein
MVARNILDPFYSLEQLYIVQILEYYGCSWSFNLPLLCAHAFCGLLHFLEWRLMRTLFMLGKVDFPVPSSLYLGGVAVA